MIMNGNASKCGATGCNMVQHGAKVWKRVQDGAGWCKARWCMMVNASAIPCNTMQYYAIPRNTTSYYAVLCNTMQRPVPDAKCQMLSARC